MRSLRDLRHFVWLLRYSSPALAGCDCQGASLHLTLYNIPIVISIVNRKLPHIDILYDIRYFLLPSMIVYKRE